MAASTHTTTISSDSVTFHHLEKLAREREVTVTELIEKTIQHQFGSVTQKDRKEAVNRLARLDAPVSDWEQMEDEITAGRLEL